MGRAEFYKIDRLDFLFADKVKQILIPHRGTLNYRLIIAYRFYLHTVLYSNTDSYTNNTRNKD